MGSPMTEGFPDIYSNLPASHGTDQLKVA